MKMRERFLALSVVLLLAGCSDSIFGSGDTTPPASPSGVEGESGDRQIELMWDQNDESDLAGYNLYRSRNSFSDVSEMDPVNGNTLIDNPGFTDPGLENGTTYYYRVTAVDDNFNESGTSSELEITPYPDPPDRP